MEDWDSKFIKKCSCGRANLKYFCKDKNCTDNEQVFYCSECIAEDDKHKHKPPIKIKDVFPDIKKNTIDKWSNLVEDYKNLDKIILDNYPKIQPLVVYLEI
jgi:hypothetical protein